MIIAIDANEANTSKRVGIGQYAYNMLCGLYSLTSEKKQKDELKGVGFEIYLKDDPKSDLPKQNKWWKYKVIGPSFAWTRIALPIHLLVRRKPQEVFFSLSHYGPLISRSKEVISVMDLSYLHFPDMFKREDLFKLKNWTKYSVAKSDKIITISNFSKSEIMKHYKIREEKIKVIYPGFDKKRFNPKKVKNERITDRYGIRGDYILYVGTLQPRKNIKRLFEAFYKLKKNKQYRGMKLVIAGKKGWLYEDIFQNIKTMGLENEVVFTGFVDDKDLPYLYSQARLFVLVSLYEGFGIPVIEAMAMGCPVVVSSISSLPEVVGRAGFFVDPKDISDITMTMEKALTLNREKLKKLKKKMKKQADKFSWKKSAEKAFDFLVKLSNENL